MFVPLPAAHPAPLCRAPHPLHHPTIHPPQCPLQPLQDNLESQTYEVFERDSIKYVKYEEAVYRALCDRAPDSQTVRLGLPLSVGPSVRRILTSISLHFICKPISTRPSFDWRA